MNDADRQMQQALMALFLAFPSQERAGNEKELAKVYLMAVEGIPTDLVAAACQRFIQGKVDRVNHTFRPTPPELACEARGDSKRRLPPRGWRETAISGIWRNSVTGEERFLGSFDDASDYGNHRPPAGYLEN